MEPCATIATYLRLAKTLAKCPTVIKNFLKDGSWYGNLSGDAQLNHQKLIAQKHVCATQ